MALAGWFYLSFANSFTLCLIVSVLLMGFALACLFSLITVGTGDD